MGIVYKLTSPSGKVYIGQCARSGARVSGKKLSAAKQLYKRWLEHCQNMSGCRAIKAAIRKYGAKNMRREVLVEVPDSLLSDYEQKFIDLYQADGKYGYNMTKGGEGGGFAIPKVRERMLQPNSKWRRVQASKRVADAKQAGLKMAKEKDPSIEIRRKKNAKDACTSAEYRARQSAILRAAFARKRERMRRTADKSNCEQATATMHVKIPYKPGAKIVRVTVKWS